ncbi:MAG: tetratricopeptide repeat protein [Polyangiaceae bacterium]|nr:tetratricopeptide repeat protein [Polyangiaceae bacterium]
MKVQPWNGPIQVLAACTLLVYGAPVRGGAPCADELARKVFEAGYAFYEAGDYEEALRSFRRSYSLCPKPEQQKNIGATHERLGNLPEAIEAYELYLKSAPPDAEDRDAIQVRIANLQKRLTPAVQPSAPASSLAPLPLPPLPEPPPPPPPPDRTAAVVALSAGGLFAVGSLITGLLARSRFQEAERSCKPSCSDSEVASIRTLAWTSIALTGAAALGTGMGVYLWWSSSSSATQTGLRGVGVQVGLEQAQLGARWAF